MLRKMAKSMNQITWKEWLFYLLLSQIIYFTMLIYSIPRINQEAGGMRLFDMKPLGYTYEYVRQFLFRLSEEGYRLYAHVQLPLDLFYPAFHAMTGMFSIALLVRLLNKVNKQPKIKMESTGVLIALCVPMAAMIADYAENTLIFAMLALRSDVPAALAFAANVFTIVKSMSTTVFYVIVLTLGIRIFAIWAWKKMKGERAGGRLWSQGEEGGSFESFYHGRNAPPAQNEASQ